jgi:hypothetical protein
MKNIVKSIMHTGKDSPHLKHFIDTCINLSISAIYRSKYKDYILHKLGISIKDLASDLVADLFKSTEGKYLYINNHFDDIIDKIDDTPEEIIKAKLSTLIISRTNQGITEMREEFGEIYFRVKRAVYLHISRHKEEFKKIIYKGNTYIFNCPEGKINLDLEQIPLRTMLDFMYASNHKKYSVTTITDKIFGILNNQADYCKAIHDVLLYQIISEFFNLRMKDFISVPENVHYYNFEEEM